jgi:1,4-alpha-glucan branching enzyme
MVLGLHLPLASAPVDPTTYPLGATIVPPVDGGGVVFRVWAPNATTAAVPGEFNSWSTTANFMTEDAPTGIWSTHIPAAQEGQEYKYHLSGSLWRIDPRSRNTVNSIGNSIITTDGSAYPWQATGWQTPDHDRMIIYEMHVGTFSGNADGVTNYPATFLDAVDTHLDDLLTLGVNMVELMPIAEFPGGVSWGYNPVHFSAPESNYGDPDDLRLMIDTFHQSGIGVILDVVYNHTSPTDNNLWDFDGPANIYFFGINCMGNTPWGDTRPKYTEQQVRSLILDDVRLWFEEYRIDGLRVDSTQFIRNYCDEMGEAWLLMGDITDAARSVNPRAIVIAEELPNTAAVTMPRSQGGAGYDAQWSDDFTDSFRAQLATINGGGDPDMGDLAAAIEFSGFGRPNDEAVKYVESHDEAGNDTRITRIIDSADPFSPRAEGLAKVAGGLTLLSPGVPMLFMGQEFLEDKPFNDGAGDRIWWGFLASYSGVRDFFGDLCDLRRQRGSLRADSGVQIIHVNNGPGAEVIGFQRFDFGGDVIFAIANFSGIDIPSYLVGVPASGAWFELVNSEDASYGGSGAVNGSVTASSTPRDGQPATLDIHLPPYSLLVFSQDPTVPAGLSGFFIR